MQTKSFNAFVAATVLSLCTTASRAQSLAYSNAIASLDPAGYWPMHEVAAAAGGDIETNYGTLGPLGEGFYPDWSSATPGIRRGAPGILTNDDDQAVSFTRGGSPSANLYTNALYVPHTSPLTTLNPPFTVECWFYPTNLTSEDIWAQCGDEGLNFGNAGGNAGTLAGIRLVWLDGSTTGFQIYSLNGSQNNVGFSGVSGENLSPSNNWYHLVVTCDAFTNVTLWVNGAQAPLDNIGGTIVNNPASYAPDYWTPITIGGGRGGTRACAGYIDEFAVYTGVLGSGEIQKHYGDAINSASQTNYFHDVTNDNPVIYLRMNAPTAYTPPGIGAWPALMNYGTTNGVAVGNGVYTPGTAPGLVTSSPVNSSGISFGGVSANLVPFNGMSSFGDAGNAGAYNPTGSNADFTVSALFRGYPCDDRIQSIVSHGTNSWQLDVVTNGHVVFDAGNGNTPAGGTGQAAGDISTIGVYNDGNWHQVVAINQTNLVFIYVDGILDTNGTPVNISVTNLINGNSGDVMIGSDPTYTNIPVGAGRQFAGQICEVAFWTNALTAGQVQTLYSNCEVAPFITAQPLANTALNGGAGTFTNFALTAKGSGTLSYQWYFNTASNYNGAARLVSNSHYLNATTSQMTVSNLAAPDNGFYYAIIQNNYGSATSILAGLTIYAAPTITNQLPATYTNLFTLFAGVNPVFSISANGAQPIHYFWYTNGVLDAAATNASFTWANVAVGTITNYCILTNIAGSATSMVWTASVITAPTAPYPTAVLSNGPMGYWRLNEPDDGNGYSDGNDGTVCHDYARGDDGIYTNMVLGQPGYSPTTDPTETAAYIGENSISFYDSMAEQILGVDFAKTNGANGEFTVEAWANGYAAGQTAGSPLVAKGLYGIDDQFNLGIDSTKTHYQFYVRAASGATYTVGSGSSPALDGNWHLVAGVCDEADGQLLLYYDGKLVNVAAIPTNSGVYEDPEPVTMGAGSTDGINYTNQFYGYLDEVAVYNQPLNISQVTAEYSAAVPGGIAPYLTQAPPTTALVNQGSTLTLPVIAAGTTPMGYYWTDVNAGTNVAMGTTNGLPLNATLTVSNVPTAWNNDQLKLTVTNAYGVTNFIVTLTILGKPIIVNDLPPQIILLSGSYTYSIGVIGLPPYNYQWFHAGAPIANQTNSTYTATVQTPGASTTYYVVITNNYGAATSSVSAFITATSPTNAYGANLLRFKPVGYWPMHEMESAVSGDTETNDGSLGALGTGYYGDWAGLQGSGIVHDFAGALPGDPDPAVDFVYTGAANTGSPTNCLLIPHTSPGTTLNPPYTVECWFYPVNDNQGDIWAQEGASALNGNGGGNWAGTRLYWNAPGFRVYTFDNNGSTQNGLGLASGSTLNTWYHLVVTCDANTNELLYVNGSLATSKAAVGLYTPDYWSPLTIGAGRGFTRAISGGVDEFAVYATNLLAADIAQHYADGTNTVAGAYKADVLADNPLIYLRMDSPTYSPPGGNWPALDNYGSAPVNGLYSPGVVPGGISGPAGAAGFVATNAMPGNGMSSFADAGYDPSFNPTGTSQALSVTAWFKGNPADSRLQTIIGHSDSSWRMNLTASGQLQFAVGSDTVLNSTKICNDGNWHQFVGVYDGIGLNEYIYVDGALDSSTAITGSAIAGSTADVFIGSDPQYTNNPAGQGHQFSGNICEAAFFTNALTASQVQQIYTATGPSVNTNPTNIVFGVTNNNLYLSWPADHTGWQLQAQTNRLSVGIGTNWVNVTGSTGANQVVVPINLTNGSVFYRLTY